MIIINKFKEDAFGVEGRDKKENGTFDIKTYKKFYLASKIHSFSKVNK